MWLNYKWLEVLIWIPAFTCFVCRTLQLQKWIYVIPGLIAITAFQMYFKSQIHWNVLKKVLTTFRALVSITSLIILIVCDMARIYIHFTDKQEIAVTIIDILIYASLCGGFVIIDACENTTRFTRFFGPLLLIIISIQNLYELETGNTGWPDTVIFTHRGIAISIKTVESGAIIQIVLFCTSLVWNVFIDWNRQNFWNLNHAIRRRQSLIVLANRFSKAEEHISQIGLPLLITNGSDTDTTKSSKSKYTISNKERRDVGIYLKNGCLYVTIIIAGISQLFFFLTDINWIIPISILCVIEFIAITILLRNNLHFEVGLIEIGKQFRVWILSLSLITIILFAALDIYLDYKDDDNSTITKSDICGLIETLLYCNTVLLGILRDALVFPLAFHILLPILILIPTYYSIYASLFLWINKPYWYLYILRTALIQIALLMQLILYSVWKDPYHLFFTLIFKKKSRDDSFNNISKIYIIKPMAEMNINRINAETPSTPTYEPLDINDIEYNMQEIIWSDREQSPISLSLSNESNNSNISNVSDHE